MMYLSSSTVALAPLRRSHLIISQGVAENRVCQSPGIFNFLWEGNLRMVVLIICCWCLLIELCTRCVALMRGDSGNPPSNLI